MCFGALGTIDLLATLRTWETVTCATAWTIATIAI